MTDVMPIDESDNCGCCLPPPNDADHRVERLLAGRKALDERLARLEVTGVRGPNTMAGVRGPNTMAGVRGPNTMAGVRGPNTMAGLRGPNAMAGLRGPNAMTGAAR